MFRSEPDNNTGCHLDMLGPAGVSGVPSRPAGQPCVAWVQATLSVSKTGMYAANARASPPCRERRTSLYLFAGPKTGVVHWRKEGHPPPLSHKHFRTHTEHTRKGARKQRAACPLSRCPAALPYTRPCTRQETTRGAGALPTTLLLPGRATPPPRGYPGRPGGQAGQGARPSARGLTQSRQARARWAGARAAAWAGAPR